MSLRKVSSHFLAVCVVVFTLSCPVSSQEKKSAYGILVDNTGSLRSQFDLVLDLTKGIVRQTYKQGPISLFSFKTHGDRDNPVAVVSSELQWSQDAEDIDQEIDSIYVVSGQTTLMDSINAIARELNARASLEKDATTDKIIFLITDGEDRSSAISEKDLLKTLKDSGIVVNCVGLVRELSNEGGFFRKAPRDKAVGFLERIAKETGGRAVFAKSRSADVNALLENLFAK